jgi:hypothetical protein
MERMATQNFN